MSKISLLVAFTLTALICIYLAIQGYRSKSGQAPGLTAATLMPCPDTANCVCSEFPNDDSHYMAPFEFSADASAKAWRNLQQAILKSGGKIVVAKDDYLAATYSVSIFGFVDDVECRLDTARQRIHIRSASRIGNSDLGVNKRRVERIAALFRQNMN